MALVGIFFGSDTGNTENIAKMIQKQLGKDVAEVRDIAKSSKEDLEAFDILLLGIPTWYYGEAQCDWDDFFPTLEEIDFNGKLVALFGCGDQEDYSSTSVMRWALSVTSLSRTVPSLLATGRVKAITSKPLKAWQMTPTSLAWPLMKTVSRSSPTSVLSSG